jgi:hypothetical protein
MCIHGIDDAKQMEEEGEKKNNLSHGFQGEASVNEQIVVRCFAMGTYVVLSKTRFGVIFHFSCSFGR